MALILSRAEGRSFYIGRDLNPKSFHSTFDLWVRVERIEEKDWEVCPAVQLRIGTKQGDDVDFQNMEVTWQAPEVTLDVRGEKVSIKLLGIELHKRGEGREIFNASLGINAPRDLRIIRDNSKKG